MRQARILVSLVAISLCACHRDLPAPPDAQAVTAPSETVAARPPPPPAPTGPMTVKAAGKETPLARGAAVVRDGALQVVLSSKPVACETLEAPSKFADDTHNVSLTVTVLGGPDGKFWPGERIGVPAQLEGLPEVKGTYIASQRLTASLDAFDAKPGSHVRGWVEFAHAEASGAGTFDVTLCHPPVGSTPTPALSGDTPGGPVAGTIAGESFAPKKAFAIVAHDRESDADHVTSIEWFTQDDVSCDDMKMLPRVRLPTFALFDVGGSSLKQDYSGTRQPAKPIFRPSTRNPKLPPLDGIGWVKLDRLALDAGKTLTGSVRGVYASGAVAGTFSAQICRQ